MVSANRACFEQLGPGQVVDRVLSNDNNSNNNDSNQKITTYNNKLNIKGKDKVLK